MHDGVTQGKPFRWRSLIFSACVFLQPQCGEPGVLTAFTSDSREPSGPLNVSFAIIQLYSSLRLMVLSLPPRCCLSALDPASLKAPVMQLWRYW